MTLHVKSLAGELEPLQLSSNSTVAQLKQQIHEKNSTYGVQQQRLFLNGVPLLQNTAKLTNIEGLSNGADLMLLMKERDYVEPYVVSANDPDAYVFRILLVRDTNEPDQTDEIEPIVVRANDTFREIKHVFADRMATGELSHADVMRGTRIDIFRFNQWETAINMMGVRGFNQHPLRITHYHSTTQIEINVYEQYLDSTNDLQTYSMRSLVLHDRIFEVATRDRIEELLRRELELPRRRYGMRLGEMPLRNEPNAAVIFTEIRHIFVDKPEFHQPATITDLKRHSLEFDGEDELMYNMSEEQYQSVFIRHEPLLLSVVLRPFKAAPNQRVARPRYRSYEEEALEEARGWEGGKRRKTHKRTKRGKTQRRGKGRSRAVSRRAR